TPVASARTTCWCPLTRWRCPGRAGASTSSWTPWPWRTISHPCSNCSRSTAPCPRSVTSGRSRWRPCPCSWGGGSSPRPAVEGWPGPRRCSSSAPHMGWALTSSCCPPRASTMPSRDSPGVTCATGSCSTCRISSPTRPGSPHPRLLLGSELLEVVGEQAVAVGQGGGVLPEPGQQEGGEPGGRRGDHARRGEADTGQPHRHRHDAGRSIQGGEGEFGDLAMGGRPRPADVQVPCRAVLELFADRCREVGAIDRRDLCPPAADHEGDAPLGHREIG